jgi:hypothetical protein
MGSEKVMPTSMMLAPAISSPARRS